MPSYCTEIKVTGEILLNIEAESQNDAEYMIMGKIADMLENHSKLKNFTFDPICTYEIEEKTND